MKKNLLLIEHAWIITVDESRRIIEDGYILIKDNRIEAVDDMKALTTEVRQSADEIIDAEQMIVMPGLVNAHSHLFQTFIRGFADDKLLYPWLKEEVWPFATAMEEKDFELAGLLGCVENIKNGATSVFDQHYIHTYDSTSNAVLGAMKSSGIRGVLCRTFSNYNYTPSLQETDETIMSSLDQLTKEWHGSENNRLKIAVGPINPWGCTVKLYQETYDYATNHGLKYQIHTAETQNVVDKCIEMYGMRNVDFFDDMGILGPNTQLAHAIYLNDDELEKVAKSKASVVHCPVANMYLADGIARVPEMREMKIPVALGTDGPGSNNSQDMLEVLKTGVILHKVNTLDPMIISADEIIEMATVEGGKMLGYDDLGRIVPGYLADIIFVDWKKAHIAPVHKATSAVVFSANGNDVDTSIVDGKVIMRHRKLRDIDEESLIEQSQMRARTIKKSLS